MRGSWRVWMTGAMVLGGLLFADGCLIRTYPIPPPTAERASSLTCAAPLCPNGGVTLTIVGNAAPGALVIAENVTRMHPGGRRYTASAWAEPERDPDAGAGDGGVGNGGRFTVTLSPETESDGTVTVSQAGDDINVVQFVRNEEGYYQQSASLMVTVPAP